MLAKRGYERVEVWERRPPPPRPDAAEWGDADRSYNMGVNARGQVALEKLSALKRIKQYSVPLQGSISWTPGKPDPVISTRQKQEYTSEVIQRDRLVACLVEEIEQCYGKAVKLRFNVAAELIEVSNDGVVLRRSDSRNAARASSELIQADFVVGADGGNSSFRLGLEKLAEDMRTVALEGRPQNTYVYKTVTLNIPKDDDAWPLPYNYKARSAQGRILEGLPTKEGLMVCTILFKEDDEEVLALSSAEEAEAFFKKEFPGLAPYIHQPDLEAFPKKRVSSLPTFRYAGPDLHYNGKIVLLGDSIHMVKPYFGVGVNAALEDVRILDEQLQDCQDIREQALPEFSKLRAPDSQAMVEMGHRADQGFIYFVLPLILDGIFHKLAPWLFEKNGIRLMQEHKLRFSAIQKRKRADRALQVAVLAAVVTGLVALLKKAFQQIVGLWQATPLPV